MVSCDFFFLTEVFSIDYNFARNIFIFCVLSKRIGLLRWIIICSTRVKNRRHRTLGVCQIPLESYLFDLEGMQAEQTNFPFLTDSRLVVSP